MRLDVAENMWVRFPSSPQATNKMVNKKCKICGRKLDLDGRISLEDLGYCSIPCACKDILKRIEELERRVK